MVPYLSQSVVLEVNDKRVQRVYHSSVYTRVQVPSDYWGDTR
jgi:hypothetical protein